MECETLRGSARTQHEFAGFRAQGSVATTGIENRLHDHETAPVSRHHAGCRPHYHLHRPENHHQVTIRQPELPAWAALTFKTQDPT